MFGYMRYCIRSIRHAISLYLYIVVQVYWLHTCLICHTVTTVILSSLCASSEYPWITSRRLLWVSNLSHQVEQFLIPTPTSKFWKLHGGGNPRFEPVPCWEFPLHGVCTLLYHVLYTVCCVGPLGMLLRSSKRLYMRIFYTLMEDKTCYFTLRTMNFTTMDEDKGLLELASYPTLEILTYPGHVRGEKHFSPPTHPVYKANKREHLYPTYTF